MSDTNEERRELRAVAAAVTGARHARMERNGQDAAVAWVGMDVAAVVVCDGCGSGGSSEVGARLGAALVLRAITRRAERGEPVTAMATWAGVRAEVGATLAALVEPMGGERAAAIREHFLFTIVAAVVTRDAAAVWALGDGAYAIAGQVRELGPFTDNQPPYLAYDLLGEPPVAHLATTAATRGTIVVATDGALDLGTASALPEFAEPRLLAHPDALRRKLALLARSHERIDWHERRVQRVPAALQDDCAIGVITWGAM